MQLDRCLPEDRPKCKGLSPSVQRKWEPQQAEKDGSFGLKVFGWDLPFVGMEFFGAIRERSVTATRGILLLKAWGYVKAGRDVGGQKA